VCLLIGLPWGAGFTIIHAANELSEYIRKGRLGFRNCAVQEQSATQKMFPVAGIDFHYTSHGNCDTAKTG